MLHRMRSVALVLALFAGAAEADSRPAEVADLARALPKGWRIDYARNALVIRHVAPVRQSGVQYWNAHTTNAAMPTSASDTAITLQLRYRTEARWSDAQLAAAHTTNAVIYGKLNALRERYKIDDIHTGKGLPLPATPDERKRLAEYDAEYARTLRSLVQLPRCTLGALSLFDDETTYSQLSLVVDPPQVMREAFAIVELVKRRCR